MGGLDPQDELEIAEPEEAQAGDGMREHRSGDVAVPAESARPDAEVAKLSEKTGWGLTPGGDPVLVKH